jgi:hypothetical protein
MFPPVVKAQRKEPLMNVQLATLVKRISELRKARLKAFDYIEEFHHRRICPLVHRDKWAYECSRMVDPNREPADGTLSILSLKCWGYPDLTFLPSCTALSREEVDEFVGRLFDKDPPTARLANLPPTYSSENSPPLVWANVILIILQPPIETLAPNPIRSSLMKMSRPSTADQTTTTAPSSGGQKKKRVALGTKCKPDKALADQVITELPPYRGPRSPLDLVAIEHIFGRLFEAFRHVCQAVRSGTSAGDDAKLSKRARAPPLKKMIVPKNMMILLLFILSLTLVLNLTT